MWMTMKLDKESSFMDIFKGKCLKALTVGVGLVLFQQETCSQVVFFRAYLDCHLMVTNPLDYVKALGKSGASGFTFHVEASKDNWQEIMEKVKEKDMRVGVTLKPGTPIEEVYPLVEAKNPVDMVLVMTVEPGFGGQKFMPEMMDKVCALRKKYPSLDI